jgi:integrase
MIAWVCREDIPSFDCSFGNRVIDHRVYASRKEGNGEDVKVVQKLLRHSMAKMTPDTYTQALSPQKRAAHSKVVSMMRPKPTCTIVIPRVSGEIPVTH